MLYRKGIDAHWSEVSSHKGPLTLIAAKKCTLIYLYI